MPGIIGGIIWAYIKCRWKPVLEWKAGSLGVRKIPHQFHHCLLFSIKYKIKYSPLINFSNIKTVAWDVLLLILQIDYSSFFCYIATPFMYYTWQSSLYHLKACPTALNITQFHTQVFYLNDDIVGHLSCVNFCNNFWRRENRNQLSQRRLILEFYKLRIGTCNQCIIGKITELQ